MTIRQITKLVPDERLAKDKRPTLTKWKGEPMIRIHSIRATIKEILQISQALDVVKVGIIGEPSTGKTTLADTIGHLCHKMSEEKEGGTKFAIRSFGKEEFLNMRATLNQLEPVNYVLKFRDLSFLTATASKKQIDQVKQVITEIRHLKEDVKIILIYDYHYTMGLDKYLRQANVRYFTSMGSSENENMLKIVGNKYHARVEEFTKMFVQMTTKHKASFRIGKKQYFSYNYKNPFVPCLFYNNSKLRYVVFPLRTWIDPICPSCSLGDGVKLDNEMPIQEFIEKSEKSFGESFKIAVKLAMFQNGLNVYSPRIVQSQRYLNQALERGTTTLEQLATHYDLSVTRTRLKKKIDDVLS